MGMEIWPAHGGLQTAKLPHITHFSMYYKSGCTKGQRSSSLYISWTLMKFIRCLKLREVGFKPSPSFGKYGLWIWVILRSCIWPPPHCQVQTHTPSSEFLQDSWLSLAQMEFPVITTALGVLCLGCVTKTVLMVHWCFDWTVLTRHQGFLFVLHSDPSTSLAEGRKETGKKHSWNKWPELANRIFHTIQCHVQSTQSSEIKTEVKEEEGFQGGHCSETRWASIWLWGIVRDCLYFSWSFPLLFSSPIKLPLSPLINFLTLAFPFLARISLVVTRTSKHFCRCLAAGQVQPTTLLHPENVFICCLSSLRYLPV